MNSHELCWAVSDRPYGGFSYGGVLISNGDIGLLGVKDVRHARNNTGNTHGSLIKIGEEGDDQYIDNFCPGCTVGFKYFDLRSTNGIRIKISGRGKGEITVRYMENGKIVSRIKVNRIGNAISQRVAYYKGTLSKGGEKEAIYFGFEGSGRFKIYSFELF